AQAGLPLGVVVYHGRGLLHLPQLVSASPPAHAPVPLPPYRDRRADRRRQDQSRAAARRTARRRNPARAAGTQSLPAQVLPGAGALRAAEPALLPVPAYPATARAETDGSV